MQNSARTNFSSKTGGNGDCLPSGPTGRLQRGVEGRGPARGSTPEGARRFQAALQLISTLDAERADVKYHFAWVLDAAARTEEAIRWYQRALKVSAMRGRGALASQDHLGAFLGLTMALVPAGRPDHARRTSSKRPPPTSPAPPRWVLCRFWWTED